MNPIDMIPLATGNGSAAANDFLRGWAESCRKAQSDQDAWIRKLRLNQVKAAHPDDGWVNRDKNEIHLAYPYFDDGLGVGDMLALGDERKFRVVEIIGVSDGLLLRYFKFKC